MSYFVPTDNAFVEDLTRGLALKQMEHEFGDALSDRDRAAFDEAWGCNPFKETACAEIRSVINAINVKMMVLVPEFRAENS